MAALADSYNPAVIFKQKREHSKRVNELAKPAKQEKKKEGPLYDSRRYLEKLSDLVGKLDEILREMKAIIKNLDTGADSRMLNKQFEAKKKEIEQIAMKSEINGDLPLSGKYSQKPKTLPLGDGAADIEFKIEGCGLKSLGITEIRIDALANAKKASSELARVKDHFDQIQRIVGSKIEVINARFASIEVAQNTDNTAIVKSGANRELRDLQERTARAEGRTYALLINIKA